MTTIISRLYEDADTANAVMRSVADEGVNDTNIVTAGDDTLAQIRALKVDPKNAAIYASHVDAGKTLVVAKVEFAPMGLALKTIEIMDAAGSLDVGLANENLYIRTRPKSELYQGSSILKGHPKFLTFSEGGRKRGRISEVFGMTLISKGRYAYSVLKGGPRISTKILPVPLLDLPRKRVSAGAAGTITSALFRTVSRSN